MKKIIKNYKLLAFLLPLLVSLLGLLPNIIINKGILLLNGDYMLQEIPFNMLFNNLIKSGTYYSWLMDLGTNAYSAFAFYNLTSPFALILTLFEESFIPYLMGPMLMIKYGVAGFTSYLFISRYTKNNKYALIGSLCYALSGFQISNMFFYHFHDAVALFPLLLYTLDNLVLDNKKGGFLLSVALLAFTNWFFFIEGAVFCIIYYFIKVLFKKYIFTFKSFGLIMAEAVLGTMIAAIVLIPVFYFTLGNPRIGSAWNLSNMFYFNSFYDYMDILRSFIMPNEFMSFRSLYTKNAFISTELLLPFISFIYAFNYIKNNKKDWLSILLIILVIFMFIPILNSIFIGFRYVHYSRWFFIPILMLSLTSSLSLEKYPKETTGHLITLLLLELFFIISIIANFFDTYIIIRKDFLIRLGISLLSIVLNYIIIKFSKKYELFLSIGIMIFSIFMIGWYACKYDRTIDKNYINNSYMKAYDYVHINDNSVRTNYSTDNLYNLGYVARNITINNFNSNISASAFKFYKFINIGRDVVTNISVDNYSLNDFLSIKYIILNDNDLVKISDDYKLIKKDGGFKIYENPNYNKMGIAYNYYMLIDDYNKIDENKIDYLNRALIINREDEEYYSNYLNRYDNKDSNNYIQSLDSSFEFIKNGFTARINSDKERFILYTIPYEDSFEITVNGEVADVRESETGFTLIKVYNGENIIEGTYHIKGFKLGLILSIISLMTSIIYITINKKTWHKA